MCFVGMEQLQDQLCQNPLSAFCEFHVSFCFDLKIFLCLIVILLICFDLCFVEFFRVSCLIFVFALCFLKEEKDTRLGKEWEYLGETGGGEIVIKVYCMKIFF